MSGLTDFVPIALMKIEGQLGHQNAIESAKFELEVLKLKFDGKIPPEMLEKHFAQYLANRKDVDAYTTKNTDSILDIMERAKAEAEAEDTISKMNAEKELHNEHEH